MPDTKVGKKNGLGYKDVIVLVIWLMIASFIFYQQTKYSNEAAHTNKALPEWPAQCPIACKSWTLVMAVHPYCACTKASLNELERLVSRAPVKINTVVLFYRPADKDRSWQTSTESWSTAGRIPSSERVDDVDGKLASEFDATTSGEVYLYDTSGHLRFHGGVTGERSHEGDNEGEDAVIAILGGSKTAPATTPVFGCSVR
jgi:hypothetical protein